MTVTFQEVTVLCKVSGTKNTCPSNGTFDEDLGSLFIYLLFRGATRKIQIAVLYFFPQILKNSLNNKINGTRLRILGI